MAVGQGPIYDNTITFPTNKSDGGATTDPQHLTATEANAIGTFEYATRTAITGGIYQGAVDQSASLPPLSPAGAVQWTSNAGQMAVSENGGPYVWIKQVDYVNLGDKRFGAKGSGTADDTAAINAWILAMTSGNRTKVGKVPEGNFRFTSPIVFPGLYGPIIEGNGVWDSSFLSDPASASTDGFVINSCLDTRLQGFQIYCKHSNPTGNAIKFAYSPVTLASSAHILNDIMIAGFDAPGAFNVGILWSDLYGNNSEVLYNNIQIFGHVTAGVSLPGSQQYDHTFFHSTINGLWNGVTAGTGGGLYGIWAGPTAAGATPAWVVSHAYAAGVVVVANGNYYTCTTGGTSASSGTGPTGTGTGITDGSAVWSYLRGSAQGTGGFSVRDSTVTSHAYADFRIDGSQEQPYVIDGLDSEGSYQTVGNGTGTYTATQIPNNLVIRNSRLSYGPAVFDAGGTINWNFSGNLCVEDNIIVANGTPSSPPLIRLVPGGAPTASVKRNWFQTANSVNFDPVVVSGSAVNYRSCCDVTDNRYATTGQAIAYRDERINTTSPAVGLSLGAMGTSIAPTRCERLFNIDLTQFNAAGSTQTITLATMPKSITYLDCRAFQYQYVTITGGATVSINIGTSFSGQELLQVCAMTTGSDQTVWYGESSGQRGTGLVSSGGTMPNGTATSNIYVQVSVSTGNLGNGTTSNITRGQVHLALEYKIQPRFLF